MMPVLCLDWETGGVDPQRHAPVTLGIALMTGDQVHAEKEWIFGRLDNIEPKFKRRAYELAALEISGITLKQIKEGTPEMRVLSEFRQFVKEHECEQLFVVSHNATFDQGFLSDWLFRTGAYDRSVDAYVPQRSPLGGPWVCTMRLAQTTLSLPDYKLDTVAKSLGLGAQGDVHSATADCILAGRIYHALTEARLATGSAA